MHHASAAGGVLFYVMDEVSGESLRQRLNREGALSREDARAITSDIAAALGAASRAGCVHRDVKPENVLLDAASGRALLADFGIARASGDADGSITAGQGITVGTPTYMSPEPGRGLEAHRGAPGSPPAGPPRRAAQPRRRGHARAREASGRPLAERGRVPWGLLPRVRLLRGAVYERMGKGAEAEQASVGLERMQRVLASKPAGDPHELSASRVEGAQCGTPPPGGRRP